MKSFLRVGMAARAGMSRYYLLQHMRTGCAALKLALILKERDDARQKVAVAGSGRFTAVTSAVLGKRLVDAPAALESDSKTCADRCCAQRVTFSKTRRSAPVLEA